MKSSKPRAKQGLIFSIVCLFTATGAAAVTLESIQADVQRRNLQFSHLTTESGLSQDMVYDIVQDRSGFIWIATQEGLNRYDGHEVIAYEHFRTDPGSLSHDFIWSLMIDRAGALWVGTGQGVNRYDPSLDRFDRHPFAEGRLPEVPVHAMLQTRDGHYWIGTAGAGLYRVRGSAGALEHFSAGNEQMALPDDTVLSLLEDRKGNLWIGTEKAGLLRFDQVLGEFVQQGSRDETSEQFLGNEIRAIHEDSLGFIWIGSGAHGASRVDPRTGRIERFRHDPQNLRSLADDKVRDVLQDPHGTIWLATNNGLSEWRERERAFVNYGSEEKDARSLLNDHLLVLFSDAAGVLWVGSWEGVSRWNYFSDTFTYYRALEGVLPGDEVTGVAESADGSLWVSTYGTGLARLNPTTGAHAFYRYDPADPASLPDDKVMTVYVDPSDQVWVGTREGGLARLDRVTQRFERFAHDPDDPTSLSANAVAGLHADATGTLWVATFGGGLNRMRPDGSFEHFRHSPEVPTSISGARVVSLAEDGEGGLLVGTFGAGLNHLDLASGEFRRFATLETQVSTGSDRLNIDSIVDVVIDPFGKVWLATMGTGLVRVDEFTDEGLLRGAVFLKDDGMPTDTFYAMLPGDRGELWLSSNRGLVRFEPASGSVRHFDSRNGLRLDEFNSGALRSRSGRLLFGSRAGLVGFYPGELPANGHLPSIYLEAQSRTETIGRANSREAAAGVQLSYLDQFLAFDFVALDFMSPDKNQYRYQLEGFDADWVEADEFRRAVYTNLPAGEFVFRVQASNNDGLWNRQGASLPVTVVPAPWHTWWAYLGYACLISVAIFLLARRQQLKLRRESEQRLLLEEEVGIRTQELAARNAELEELNDRLAEASVTDSLTGLRNRRYVDQFINSEVSLFERNKKEDQPEDADASESTRTMFFMMIDLDGFKLINDQNGHNAGDAALIQVKDILESCSREADTLIRWGGDEFMVIGFSSGFFGVKILAERIREAIASHRYDLGNGQFGRLSASIGIAPYPLVEEREQFCGWETVVGVADQAAYIAKASGRNAWVSLSGTEHLDAQRLMQMCTDLAEFVERGVIQVDSSIETGLVLPDRSGAAA